MEKAHGISSKESRLVEGSPIAKGRGRLRKTIGETIKRDLDFKCKHDS